MEIGYVSHDRHRKGDIEADQRQFRGVWICLLQVADTFNGAVANIILRPLFSAA